MSPLGRPAEGYSIMICKIKKKKLPFIVVESLRIRNRFAANFVTTRGNKQIETRSATTPPWNWRAASLERSGGLVFPGAQVHRNGEKHLVLHQPFHRASETVKLTVFSQSTAAGLLADGVRAGTQFGARRNFRDIPFLYCPKFSYF